MYHVPAYINQEGEFVMDQHIIVAKFGGTSVADAGQFRKIRDIVTSDSDRRFIVVSAPGKRFSEDRKEIGRAHV